MPTLSKRIKGNDKGHLQQATKGLEGEQRYSATNSQPRRWEGVGGQHHAPATLSPGKTRYPFYRRLGGPVWTCAKNLAHTGNFFSIWFGFVRILYFIVLVLDFQCSFVSYFIVIGLVGVIINRYWGLRAFAPRSSPPSPPEDDAYWPDTQRTPLAKKGTNGFGQQFRNFSKRAGFFYVPQSWDMGSWVPEASMLTTRPPKPLGFDPRTVQPVVSRYTDWATGPT
jgi:hypothetical protein